MNTFIPVIFSIFHFFNKYRKIGSILGTKITEKYAVFQKKDEAVVFDFGNFLSFENSRFLSSQNRQSFFFDEKSMNRKLLKQNILFFHSDQFFLFKNPRSSLFEFFIRFSKYSNIFPFDSKKQDSFFVSFANHKNQRYILFDNLPPVSKTFELSSEIQKGIFVSKLSLFKKYKFSI